jgi:hypothetical protein
MAEQQARQRVVESHDNKHQRAEGEIVIDNVNHPSHYTSDKSGVECIEITRHRNFNIGNAIKYLWRAGLKDSGVSVKHIEDLHKAIFYITREIENLERDIEDADDDRTEDYTESWVQSLWGQVAAYQKVQDSMADHPAGKGIRLQEVAEYYEDECNNIHCELCS